MKKIVTLILVIVLSIVGVIGTVAAIDTPAETKAVEWERGYALRCRTTLKTKRRNGFLRKVLLAPLTIVLGVSANPTERYWSVMANGATPAEAKASFADATAPVSKGKRASHPKWSETEQEKVHFLSVDEVGNAVKAKRGWFSAAKLSGFDDETVLVYQWFDKDADRPRTKPDEEICLNGQTYELWCASQGGVKKGSAIYIKKSFLDEKTGKTRNRIRLDSARGLSASKQNQVRSLRFTACKRTKARMSQVIVFTALRRTDKKSDMVDGRPVVHVDVPNKYAMSIAEEVEQALADGGAIYGPESGIRTPVGQFRNDGGLKFAACRHTSKYYGPATRLDAFGRKVEITASSIIITTDCAKDIKPFIKKVENGEMSGEEAYQAWLSVQGGPNAPLYACEVHPTNKRVRLGRQLFGKFSQLTNEDLLKVAGRDIGKLAELGFEGGYKANLQRKYRALKLPELANVLDSPLLRQGEEKSYLSTWHKVASGGVEVDASLALAVIDPVWFDDVYCGGKDVSDSTAGEIDAGTIGFGVADRETGRNDLIGKKVVLARFPQVKSGLPVVTVKCSAPASGVIVVSGRPGDMVLQDLDADLDGDKFYVIDEVEIVVAVEKANEIFNFPHVIFTKWEADEKPETIAEYLGRNARWQNEESVGTFAVHQFVIDEMVPLLEEGQDWKQLVRPTLDKDGNYSKYVPIEDVFKCNNLLGVAGNMATDSGKLNHKPMAPDYIKTMVAFRPMSQRDAHPNSPDSGNKKRHSAFLPGKYIGVASGVLKRLHDMMMTYIPIVEVGRSEVNDFSYDENGRILPDIPKTLWSPTKFTPVPENVWIHKFGNELDKIKFCPVLDPNSVKSEELNNDIQIIEDKDISLVTYFTQYATKLMSIEAGLDDDKKGWTVAAKDTFGDNLIAFVRTATETNMSTEDALWIVYNTLCRSYIGTSSQSRGTAYGMSQFLKLFEQMLISQVCENCKKNPPKIVGNRPTIKDSVSKEETNISSIETVDEEPPTDVVDINQLKAQLLNDNVGFVDEEPPAETVDTKAMLAQLKAEQKADEQENQVEAEEDPTEDWSLDFDPMQDDEE